MNQAPWKNSGASRREVAEGPAKTFSPGAERLFGGHLGSWLTDIRCQATLDGEDFKSYAVLSYIYFWSRVVWKNLGESSSRCEWNPSWELRA